ncbi:MAG: hypothetical protein WBZ24_11670 [Anaerolineales bacterium]|jgi:hypothetical protein
MAKKTASAKKSEPKNEESTDLGQTPMIWVVVALVVVALMCSCCLVMFLGWTYGDQVVGLFFPG